MLHLHIHIHDCVAGHLFLSPAECAQQFHKWARLTGRGRQVRVQPLLLCEVVIAKEIIRTDRRAERRTQAWIDSGLFLCTGTVRPTARCMQPFSRTLIVMIARRLWGCAAERCILGRWLLRVGVLLVPGQGRDRAEEEGYALCVVLAPAADHRNTRRHSQHYQ